VNETQDTVTGEGRDGGRKERREEKTHLAGLSGERIASRDSKGEDRVRSRGSLVHEGSSDGSSTSGTLEQATDLIGRFEGDCSSMRGRREDRSRSGFALQERASRTRQRRDSEGRLAQSSVGNSRPRRPPDLLMLDLVLLLVEILRSEEIVESLVVLLKRRMRWSVYMSEAKVLQAEVEEEKRGR